MASEWIQKKKHSDTERWTCIYPAYINSKKTRAEGRRISLANAVDNPTYAEIKDVLAATGFNVVAENKAYSKERSNEPTTRGRIRVELRNDDGTPVNPKYPTRDSLLSFTAEMIPKLKTRMNPSSGAPQVSAAGGKKKGKKK